MASSPPAPKASGPRGVVLLLGVSAAAVLAAALLATGLNRLMWGYWLWRPAPDPRVLRASQVVTVTPVAIQEDSAGVRWFVPSGSYNGPGWYVPNQVEADYYLLDRRVLLALERAGMLTGPVPALPKERLARLMPLVWGSGQLASQTPGYDQFEPGLAGGTVYELRGPAGEPLLLLALRGAEVSNDHRPFYEFLFETSGSGPRLLSSRLFFFDIAGLEGIEFVGLFAVFSIIGLFATVPPTGAFLIYRRFSKAAAIKRGCCPRCRYDLCGRFEGGCPECGWGRGERGQDGPGQTL